MKQNRLERVIRGMEAMGLEQIIVSAPASVFYLTGTWVRPGERMLALYVHKSGEARLFANRLFALSGNVDAPLSEFDDTEDPIALLSRSVRPGTLGIDKSWPSHFTLRLMEARGDVRCVVGSAPVDDARMCKDEEEIALMRESSLKNDQAIVTAMGAHPRRGQGERRGRGLRPCRRRAGGDGQQLPLADLLWRQLRRAAPFHGRHAFKRRRFRHPRRGPVLAALLQRHDPHRVLRRAHGRAEARLRPGLQGQRRRHRRRAPGRAAQGHRRRGAQGDRGRGLRPSTSSTAPATASVWRATSRRTSAGRTRAWRRWA